MISGAPTLEERRKAFLVGLGELAELLRYTASVLLFDFARPDFNVLFHKQVENCERIREVQARYWKLEFQIIRRPRPDIDVYHMLVMIDAQSRALAQKAGNMENVARILQQIHVLAAETHTSLSPRVIVPAWSACLPATNNDHEMNNG